VKKTKTYPFQRLTKRYPTH